MLLRWTKSEWTSKERERYKYVNEENRVVFGHGYFMQLYLCGRVVSRCVRTVVLVPLRDTIQLSRAQKNCKEGHPDKSIRLNNNNHGRETSVHRYQGIDVVTNLVNAFQSDRLSFCPSFVRNNRSSLNHQWWATNHFKKIKITNYKIDSTIIFTYCVF